MPADDQPPAGSPAHAAPGTAGKNQPGSSIESGRIRRTAPLVGMVARTTGESVVASLRHLALGTDKTEFHERTAERYTQLLGRSKGVLMKAGQMLSFVSLSSAVPSEYRSIYQNTLSRLQQDAPPMAPELARQTLEDELGADTDTFFSEFDWEPVAAASIGQVHKATTRDGRYTAVKIQYPGVADAIRSDLGNAELLATFFQLIKAIVPGVLRMDVRSLAKEISERIEEEVDYTNEADNQRAFAELYRGHPFIKVPEVIEELSTSRVITQEFAEGMRWSEALSASQDLRDQWGEVIWRFGIGTMRRFGLFNGDPHPGNYLFHENGSVTFVDFGCVKKFTKEQIGRIKRLVSAIIRGDAETILKEARGLGLFDPTDDLTGNEVADWYRESFAMCRDPQPFEITSEYVAGILQHEYSLTGPVSKVFRSVNPPSDYVFLSRIEMGLLSVLGELRSTGYWGSIEAEYDDGSVPVTELGRLEAEFWEQHPKPWAGR